MTTKQAAAKATATNRNSNKIAAIKDFIMLMGYDPELVSTPKTWKEALDRFQ